MRDIKFRGKTTYCFTDPPECEWVYGSLQISYEGFTRIIPLDPAGPWCGVGPETIGQYIGLKDKNGVEIYEGDVVDVVPILGIHFRGVVKFNNHTIAFDVFREERGDSACLKDDFSVEVRGNIFDNPELDKQFGEVYRKEQ